MPVPGTSCLVSATRYVVLGVPLIIRKLESCIPVPVVEWSRQQFVQVPTMYSVYRRIISIIPRAYPRGIILLMMTNVNTVSTFLICSSTYIVVFRYCGRHLSLTTIVPGPVRSANRDTGIQLSLFLSKNRVLPDLQGRYC